MSDEIPDTVYGLLRRGARIWPDRTVVLLEGGAAWTWSQALAEGSRAANVMADHGVRRGDRVMMPLPNGAAWLRTWWGCALLDAVMVPVNPSYRGRMLADICDLVDPTLIVAEPEMAERLPDRLRALVLAPENLTVSAPEIAELDEPPGPWDIHCLLMTSGTTGPSKASITTNAFVCDLAAWLVASDDGRPGIGHGDVFQADMPWFHLSSFAPAVQMMRTGGRIAPRMAPAMTNYWQTAKDLGSTFAVAPGTVAQFLESQPPSPADRDHSMRFVLCSPLPADPERFMDRFGLEGMATAYGSTEQNLVAITPLGGHYRAGSCGRLRTGFEARIVDEHDMPVPPGEVGELIVRSDRPWVQSQGYFNRPDTTVTAWRNGWFHTGDALRVDDDGFYFFHDRYKDALRRRGENISSYEVERDVLAFPGIAEVACVAHPGDFGGDDEVKVFVVASHDVEVNLDELVVFLVEHMAYYMVPRYFELIDELPKTPTHRVQKHLLRERGNTAATWDREAAGYRLTRQGLARTVEPRNP